MTSPAEHAATVDALEMIVRGRGSPVPGRLLISPSELHTLLDAARKAEKAEAERDRLKAHVARHRQQMEDYEGLEAERDRLSEDLDMALTGEAQWKMHNTEAHERAERLQANFDALCDSFLKERARVEELEVVLRKARHTLTSHPVENRMALQAIDSALGKGRPE